MTLTNAQLDTLKTWLTSGPGAGLQDEEARAALNAPAVADFFVFHSAVPAAVILDKVNYANYTPNDSPDQATQVSALVWNNRALLIQLKQANLFGMIRPGETFDATKASLRDGLKDSTQNLPSGTAGANRAGGWSNIEPVLARKATAGEKLFASGGGNGTTAILAANLGIGSDGANVEGQVSSLNINDARSRP